MKLEDQVVSLELAKRLKELGVKQGTYFYWCNPYRKNKDEWILFREDRSFPQDESSDYYSAFTVAELGEMLPAKLGRAVLVSGKREKQCDWYCDYHIYSPGHYEQKECVTANSEADARANLLIELIEKGLLKP